MMAQIAMTPHGPGEVRVNAMGVGFGRSIKMRAIERIRSNPRVIGLHVGQPVVDGRVIA